LLEKVLFTLDEVDDVPVTARDCDSIHLNRFYTEYEVCLDMCWFFLSDSYLSRQDAHQRHFCFLLPTDYVFENFVAGVTQQHLGSSFIIEPQAKGWLATDAQTNRSVFQIC
jgi:5-methylcytosine-specific restriction enzyme subunit McrC